MAKKKHEKPGQPTLYRQEYCALLVEHMSQGLSYEAFAGVVGVSRQTLYDWEHANQEFSDAKKAAVEKSRLFWEKLGIDNIINESFGNNNGSRSLNASTWIFNMKNRFGWRDKQPDEVDTVINNNNSVSADTSDEELDKKIQEKLKKINGKSK